MLCPNSLNNLQANHAIYFSAALNRQPKHFEMLESLGLKPALVHQATAHEAIYQGIMRTSLRNPDSTTKVRVIVPDQPGAERLGQILGCRDISQIGNVLSPPKRPLSQRDRSRRDRLACFKESIFAPRRYQSHLLMKMVSPQVHWDRESGQSILCCDLPQAPVHDESLRMHMNVGTIRILQWFIEDSHRSPGRWSKKCIVLFNSTFFASNTKGAIEPGKLRRNPAVWRSISITGPSAQKPLKISFGTAQSAVTNSVS